MTLRDMTPLMKAIAKLLKVARTSDTETIQDAVIKLGEFGDSWLITGAGDDMEGAGACFLADTDITEALKEVLSAKIN